MHFVVVDAHARVVCEEGDVAEEFLGFGEQRRVMREVAFHAPRRGGRADLRCAEEQGPAARVVGRSNQFAATQQLDLHIADGAGPADCRQVHLEHDLRPRPRAIRRRVKLKLRKPIGCCRSNNVTTHGRVSGRGTVGSTESGPVGELRISITGPLIGGARVAVATRLASFSAPSTGSESRNAANDAAARIPVNAHAIAARVRPFISTPFRGADRTP